MEAVPLDEARRLLRAWAGDPRPLPRPVVIVTGWLIPAWWVNSVHRWLERCSTNGHVVVMRVPCAVELPLPLMAERLIERAGGGPVDVVGISLGGVLAREAARTNRSRRLDVRRMFTIASPHRGARLVARFVPHHQARAVAPGSRYLDELNADASSQSFPITTFRLRGDHLINRASAHAVGTMHADWEPLTRLLPAHSIVAHDPRVLAMIVGAILGQ